MKKQFVAMVTVLMVTLTAGACVGGMFERGSWKYKMTVTVETPEGLKTGSAVREVGYHTEPEILPPQGGIYHNVRRGEAVVVDLGARGVLFSLLGGSWAHLTPLEYFPDARDWKPSMGAQAVTLPIGYWPQFVTFTDMDDPKTVQRVLDIGYCRERSRNGNCIKEHKGHIDIPARKEDGFIKENRMEEFFGQGVSIKSVTIEMTDEDVTTGVVEYLPWLPEYYNQRLDGNRYGTLNTKYRTANSLSAGSFSTEAKE